MPTTAQGPPAAVAAYICRYALRVVVVTVLNCAVVLVLPLLLLPVSCCSRRQCRLAAPTPLLLPPRIRCSSCRSRCRVLPPPPVLLLLLLTDVSVVVALPLLMLLLSVVLLTGTCTVSTVTPVASTAAVPPSKLRLQETPCPPGTG